MDQVDFELARGPDGTLRVALAGDWKLACGIPAPVGVIEEIERSPLPRKVIFETGVLAGWDSGLLTFLLAVLTRCTQLGVEVDRHGLPEGVRRLLALATAVPARPGRRSPEPEPLLARVGDATIGWWRGCGDMLAFIGEAFLSLLRLFSGKARFRRSDFLLVVQDCGARSLPIVALINLLVGLILAFVGAIELRRFGAQIYVADLVGIGMLRDIAPIMTGIIVAGRTGASFAAQLGTMEANQEIDALRTLGIPPMDFLVLPRLLALSLMMPLLCLYADLMGIAGGLVVGGSMLGISPVQYLLETKHAIHLNDLFLGLFMSAVFGVLVALAGCLRGVRSGRSASGVGEATTSAVVTGIVSIVVATALITGISYVLGI
ncbi:MAG: ABC transporter permease [Deltaproteobacteria bacterium]|nr:MAG: ABC transporter permease [Deltaproteobacteria bacterium]